MIKRMLFNLIFISVFIHSAYATQPLSKAITQQKQTSLTPERALALLKTGNQRFIKGQLREYDFAKEMKITTKKGQHPLAVILSCIDSRSIPDILFDQGLGNLFVSRIAGNVADKEILGSMEFASLIAGAPLIVVMGHTHCGAVEGACQSDGDTGFVNLDYLLAKIKPAVKTVKKDNGTISCKKPDTINDIAKQNVLDQLAYIASHSKKLEEAVKAHKIMLVGAMHDIRSGNVDFFNAKGDPL